ncbi:MAG TPA: M20 family metallopeptidase, partial [Patescibacteria group bacterium]|nr:M20 family metallopeptidase [Patescibacteria group bacterium]
MTVLDEAKKISDEIVNWRRELHKIPEIGLVLPQTVSFIKARLEEMDIPYTTFERHSGIVALVGKKTGKTIALRADMDGLRINEESDFEYRSQNSNMHACGHDAHTAILLGTAKLLKQHEAELNGQVKLLFQPAEEGPGGALPMIEDGVLENPKVDAIFALHMDRKIRNVPAKNGDVIVKYGNSSAADDQVDITIIGKSGHGSEPNRCVDPITTASLVVTAIQHIVSREINPFSPCVISFGTITGGNGAENIIPNTVALYGTIRNQDLATRDFVFQRLEEVVKYITKAMRADYKIAFRNGYPPTCNDTELVDCFLASARKILPEEDIQISTEESMGGEDAGFFYQKVPGCFFRLVSSAPFADGESYPAHSSKFVLDDSVLYRGTALFLQ